MRADCMGDPQIRRPPSSEPRFHHRSSAPVVQQSPWQAERPSVAVGRRISAAFLRTVPTWAEGHEGVRHPPAGMSGADHPLESSEYHPWGGHELYSP